MNQPKVSVITVVYNAASLIEKTIENIIGQSYPNLEFIVIDGGSKDGTIDLIQKHKGQIDYWISEPDRGIYDAMNKGLKASTGDFVWFINAGDLIYTPETTAQIFQKCPMDTDILYGDTMVVDAMYNEIGLRRLRPPKNLSWKSFRKGMLVCHQAILVKRSLADEYNLNYPHSADFDWVLRVLKKATRIHNTNQVLAAFLDGGQSKHTIGPSLKERFQSMRKHYGLFTTFMNHIPIAFRFLFFVFRNRRF